MFMIHRIPAGWLSFSAKWRQGCLLSPDPGCQTSLPCSWVSKTFERGSEPICLCHPFAPQLHAPGSPAVCWGVHVILYWAAFLVDSAQAWLAFKPNQTKNSKCKQSPVVIHFLTIHCYSNKLVFKLTWKGKTRPWGALQACCSSLIVLEWEQHIHNY